MMPSLKESRDKLLDQLVEFLWGQWTALGVPGRARARQDWVLDPEPLLVFTLPIARYEPRLFDEVLAWVLVNGRWLDSARLRRLLKELDPQALRVVGGALQYAATHGDKRKWRSLAELCRKSPRTSSALAAESLFREKEGTPHPLADESRVDPDFLLFGLNRPLLRVRKPAREVPVDARTNLRFPLRALLGVGAKSECVAYLLTHSSGRPKRIADSVGLFWLSIHQALQDLAKSGLVFTTQAGKRPDYRLSPTRWFVFLGAQRPDGSTPPAWLDWLVLYSAVTRHWQTIEELAFSTASDYIKGSRLRASLEMLWREAVRSGIDIPRAPAAETLAEGNQRLAADILKRLLELEPAQ